LQFLLIELLCRVIGLFGALRTLSGQSFVHCLLNERFHFVALIVHHTLELVFHFIEHLSRFLHTQSQLTLVLGFFSTIKRRGQTILLLSYPGYLGLNFVKVLC